LPSRTIFRTKSICHLHHVPCAWLQMLAGYKTPSRSASASFLLYHTALRLFTKMVLLSVHGCSQNQDCANLWRVWTTIRKAFDEWYRAAGFRRSTCEQEWRSFFLCDFWVDLRNEKAFITFTMLCAWLAPSTPARTRRYESSQSIKTPLFCFFSCTSQPLGLLPKFTTDRGIRPTGCVLETEEDGSERFQEGTTGKEMSAVLLAVFVVSEIYLQRRHGSRCVGVECNEKISATVRCGGGG
jgi:hypothetical protein